jgi:hypothetical protein
MWPQDRAAALGGLDQSQVLRQVLSQFCEDALAAPDNLFVCVVTLRRFARPGLPPRAATVDHRATCADANLSAGRSFRHYQWSNCSGAINIDQSNNSNRRNRRRLHLRRAHKERHPVFSPRTWTSTLLATQRRLCNASAGKAAG